MFQRRNLEVCPYGEESGRNPQQSEGQNAIVVSCLENNQVLGDKKLIGMSKKTVDFFEKHRLKLKIKISTDNSN
jgi:hypothetical protein